MVNVMWDSGKYNSLQTYAKVTRKTDHTVLEKRITVKSDNFFQCK